MRQLITILFFGITLAGAQQPATRFTNTYRNQINAFVQEHINRLSADIQKNEKLFDQITAPCGGKSQTVNPDVKKRFLEELNARIRNDLELIFANASVAEKDLPEGRRVRYIRMHRCLFLPG